MKYLILFKRCNAFCLMHFQYIKLEIVIRGTHISPTIVDNI